MQSKFKDFDEYQKMTRKTAVYPHKGKNFIFPAIGLFGESGEIANKIKKVVRDDSNKITNERKEEIAGEVGDMLWYTAQLLTELKINFSDVVNHNLVKISKRVKENKIHGSGDNR